MSDLAVFQVRVNVLDQGIIRVTDREDKLAQWAAPDITLLLRLHPQVDRWPRLSMLYVQVSRWVATKGVGAGRNGEGGTRGGASCAC